MPYLANPELAAIYWLKSFDNGLPTDQVGTVLPSVNNTDFQDNGFIQVLAYGGTPDAYTFKQESLIQIDTWAFNLNSNKAPWGKALNLAMLIKDGLTSAARVVETPAAYNDVYVFEALVRIDPRRITNDEANFARYSMDLELHWRQHVGAVA